MQGYLSRKRSHLMQEVLSPARGSVYLVQEDLSSGARFLGPQMQEVPSYARVSTI